MFLRTLIGLAFIALGAATASAQDPTVDSGGGPARNFGGPGQFAFSSDATLVIQHSSGGQTSLQLAPAADYFLIQNLSVGGSIGFDYEKVKGDDSVRLSIGPRAGYNFVFTNLLSFWPKIGFAYAYSSHGGSAFAFNLFTPVMIHPTTHFFAGFGPFLDVDLSGNDRVTVYGAKLTLGGWLG